MNTTDRLFYALLLGVGLAAVGAGVVVARAAPPGQVRAPTGVLHSPLQTGSSPEGPGDRPAPRAKARALKRATPRRPSQFSQGARRRRRLVFAQVQGDQAFQRLPEPEPGDWLYSFREPGQTLNEYCRTVTNRKRPGRQTLHLLPFTDLTPRQRVLLEPIRRQTALFFETRVEVLPARSVQPGWYHRQRRQYDADRIVRHLARKVPDTSLGLFGLMGSDLYGIGLNFVFGEALLYERAGIYSLRRYGTEPTMLLRRALKLSSHELGHMFGLKHCVFYACVMNGVNSLQEMDRSPLHLCPVCLAKLQWNLKFDPVQRYHRLGALYRELGLEPEARFVLARAAELAQP